MLSGLVPNSIISVSSLRSASSRSPTSSPKTARRMASRVSAWTRGCSGSASPAGQRAISRLGDLGDDVAQRGHPISVEGGEHQLALREVLALVEQQDRVRADDRLEDPCPLAGMEDVGGSGEDLP